MGYSGNNPGFEIDESGVATHCLCDFEHVVLPS